jgi:hypothetical protein
LPTWIIIGEFGVKVKMHGERAIPTVAGFAQGIEGAQATEGCARSERRHQRQNAAGATRRNETPNSPTPP